MRGKVIRELIDEIRSLHTELGQPSRDRAEQDET